MTKSDIIKSFGMLFQDYLYKSGKPLTKANLNAWIKKEQWDKVYQVTGLYTSEHIEIKFKYKEIGSTGSWSNYEAVWTLKY